MRHAIVSLAVLLATASALGTAVADEPAAAHPKTVYLVGEASLDELRASNPLHYARAAKILAAAPQLCRFDTPQAISSAFEARDVHCLRGLIKTSLPPKWELDFRLDDVNYVALVTVTGFKARLLPAR